MEHLVVSKSKKMLKSEKVHGGMPTNLKESLKARVGVISGKKKKNHNNKANNIIDCNPKVQIDILCPY